jgi:hypothetical protein
MFSHKAKTLRNLHRLAIPHPLLQGHPGQHLPTSLHNPSYLRKSVSIILTRKKKEENGLTYFDPVVDLNVLVCGKMKGRDEGQRLHFDTTYENIQVNHWIKVCQTVFLALWGPFRRLSIDGGQSA